MRKKLQRFKENYESPFVIEEGKPFFENSSGKWHEEFQNKNPIVVELGCGKGIYTIALAKRHPNKNFIGVDIKGDRIWYGMQEAKKHNLKNVRFLRTRIELIEESFFENEISEIWITFPDPHPKKGSANRRMTGPRFLDRYTKLLKPSGILHLKTDSQLMHNFTRKSIRKNENFTKRKAWRNIKHLPEDHLLQQVQTPYEKRFRSEGKPITYLQAINAMTPLKKLRKSLLPWT